MYDVEAGVDIFTTPASTRTEKELREAILEQTVRVRKLKVKPEIEEATRELVFNLKFLTFDFIRCYRYHNQKSRA